MIALALTASGVVAAPASALPNFETEVPQTFSFTGGEAVLQTAAGTKLTCKTTTSPSSGFVSYVAIVTPLTFKECSTTIAGIKIKCNSSGAATGEVKTNSLTMTLVYLKQTSHEVGLRIENGGTVATYQCGSGLHGTVRGSTLAKITPVNTTTTSYPVSLHGSGGVQELTKFENASGELISTLLEYCGTSGSECTTFEHADINIAGLELHTASSTRIAA